MMSGVRQAQLLDYKGNTICVWQQDVMTLSQSSSRAERCR